MTKKKQKHPKKGGAQKSPGKSWSPVTRRALFVWLPFIIISITFIFSFYYDPEEETGTVEEGIVENFHQSPSKEMSLNYLLVKLSNSEMINVPVDKTIAYHKGKRVQLSAIKTRIYGRVKYAFIKYLQD